MMPFYGSKLTIDLSALADNYRFLSSQIAAGSSAECAGVVKANAYGLGVKEVSRALWDAGCRQFFVAHLKEAMTLRESQPEAIIYVLHGLHHPEEVAACIKHRLSPVLPSPEQIEWWAEGIRGLPDAPSSVLHVDTGMRRLGLYGEHLQWARANAALLEQAKIFLVMSHLACADEPEHSLNAIQLKAFHAVVDLLPHAKRSFANSSGIMLGSDYHFDLLRPGIALYGSNPTPHLPNPMKPVATLTTPILQLHQLDVTHSIGYGATCERLAGARLATVEIGYADGYFRSLSNKGFAVVAGKRVPIVGRVTMDLITLDVSNIPEAELQIGTSVEFLGAQVPVDEVAALAGTIGYEVLTNLGQRYQRCYVTE